MINSVSIFDLMSSGVVVDTFSNVLAYLDPGTGSLVLQFVIAGFLSAMVALKAYWHVIASFFRSKTSSTENDNLTTEQKLPQKSEKAAEQVGRKAA